jgi:thiamine-phosphate pyrophosphorylase
MLIPVRKHQQRIAPFQYITHPAAHLSMQDQVERICAAGGNWIQFRWKDATTEQATQLAGELAGICKNHRAILIINDRVELTLEVQADGVHLGQHDMSPAAARKILGDDYIIGGTANTFADLQRLYVEGVDYIGLGPFRQTTTKARLGPVLGLQGYVDILEACRAGNINLPVIAIGGITPADITGLRATGVHGVAVSSSILQAADPGQTTRDILAAL